MGYPITNKTVKLLKFILKHENCKFSEIQSVFKEDADPMELVNLGLTDYVVCTRSNGTLTQFKDGVFTVGADDCFWASPKAVQLLEERRRAWIQWVIPNVISGIALILSIITLLLSLQPQVTTVWMLP